MFESLTEFEYQALDLELNLADGHSRHDLSPHFHKIFMDLGQIWREGANTAMSEVERQFRNAFAGLVGSELLVDHDGFVICPTASNSIDMVSAWLSERGATVGLIEPCFDNLALLLRRRGFEPIPILESTFRDLDTLTEKLNHDAIDCLFLVNPNNPTGLELSHEELCSIADFCKAEKITLVIDTTFRLFARDVGGRFIDYLLSTEVSFVLIEDTGKTFPTQELKASLVITSNDNQLALRRLYEEVYLCVSNFTLLLLIRMFEVAASLGIGPYLHEDVKVRRQITRHALARTSLVPAAESIDSGLGVEWVDCSGTEFDDLGLTQFLNTAGLSVLPGRYFYWQNGDQGRDRVRLSLMKPMDCLSKSLHVLKNSFEPRVF